jgi:hypothetical protein
MVVVCLVHKPRLRISDGKRYERKGGSYYGTRCPSLLETLHFFGNISLWLSKRAVEHFQDQVTGLWGDLVVTRPAHRELQKIGGDYIILKELRHKIAK